MTRIIVKIFLWKIVEEEQSCLLESNLGIQDISCLSAQPTFLIFQRRIKFYFCKCSMKTFSPFQKYKKSKKENEMFNTLKEISNFHLTKFVGAPASNSP